MVPVLVLFDVTAAAAVVVQSRISRTYGPAVLEPRHVFQDVVVTEDPLSLAVLVRETVGAAVHQCPLEAAGAASALPGVAIRCGCH